jgi:hypothetical protein
VEVEAPKGNFVVIHRCGICGKLIAPPNYHRYAHLLEAHAAELGKPLDFVKSKLESVKEPEEIAKWLESMKTTTRYTELTVAEGAEPKSFDSKDAACAYLIEHHKLELVHALPQVRVGAKIIATLPKGEVRRSIEAARLLQHRFPLNTANNIRGRMRRLGFTIYKRGSKGASYLCAVKRKFRTPGQAFTAEIAQIFEFLDKNPMVSINELPKQLLGITPPAETTPVLTTEETAAAQAAPAPTPVELTAEETEAYRKLKTHLQMLIEEGYISLFGDGKLLAPAPREENAPKSEEEKDEESEPSEDKADEVKTEETSAPAASSDTTTASDSSDNKSA